MYRFCRSVNFIPRSKKILRILLKRNFSCSLFSLDFLGVVF